MKNLNMKAYKHIFKRFYLFSFRERGREGEREGQKHLICERDIHQLPLARPQLGTKTATQACALTGNRNIDLSVCRLALSPLSHSSQGQEVVLYVDSEGLG